MNRHAYLIIAHNQFEILKILLKTIDDSRNDIYIHIDKKCQNICMDEFVDVCKKSHVYCMSKYDIRWGDVSSIKCELYLLKYACKNGKYQYIHLLSGVDLPLCNQDMMHEYFDKNSGKEYVHFCTDEFNNSIRERYRQYHFFSRLIGPQKKNLLWKYLDCFLIKMQKLIGIYRNRDIDFYSGSNWFSITNEFAEFLITNEKKCIKMFKYTECCDEVFLQTFLKNSQFRNRVSSIGNLRKIDWNRGNPYVWEKKDWAELDGATELFARKFSCHDMDIVKNIEHKVLSKNNMKK